MTPLPQCRLTHALAAHEPMPLCARNACPPSRLPKRHRGPRAHLATRDSSHSWFRAQAQARRAVCCRRALAASDAVSGIKEVDVRQAADLGTPARIIGNASLLHILALSLQTSGAEEALRLLGPLSRIVPGSRAEVLRTIVELAEVFAWMNPVVIVGTKLCMCLIIRTFCILFDFRLYFNAGFLKGSPPSG